MGAIWSDENRYRNWLRVELAVMQARAEAGEIPLSAYEETRQKANFSVQRIEQIEVEVRHDVIAFINNVSEHIGENSRYFHQGLTSSDVLDTALALQIQESAGIIRDDLHKLLDIIALRAKEYKYTPIAGRTHGVHAEPTTFGLKLAGFYAEFTRDLDRFQIAVEGLNYGKMSGAVGTYSLLKPEIEQRVMEILGLKVDPISSQIVQRDRHAYYLTTIAVIGGTLERLALEIRNLARTEVNEVLEPFGQKQRGSSAMPHKKNPVLCENICGLARILRSNALSALENQALWHERDISHSSVERIILPDSTILLDYMLERATFIVQGMSVFPQNMARNLEMTGGLIYSQSILNLLLDKGMDRDSAYKIVQDCAMRARNEGREFLEVLLSNSQITKIASEAEIRDSMKIEVKYVDQIFKRLGLD
jgi:adenylosuccinate lyase